MADLEANEHLVGITLRRMPYFRWSADWDHDHCELCWTKLVVASDAGDEEARHEGYTYEGVEGIRDHYWDVIGKATGLQGFDPDEISATAPLWSRRILRGA